MADGLWLNSRVNPDVQPLAIQPSAMARLQSWRYDAIHSYRRGSRCVWRRSWRRSDSIGERAVQQPVRGATKVQAFEPLVDKRVAALLDEAKAAYSLHAAQRRVAASEPVLTADEREASMLIVECVHGSSFSACSPAPGA